MADTTAFVVSCTRTGENVVLVLGDALSAPSNTFTATFPISDEMPGGSKGAAVTTLIQGLFCL